MAKLIELESKRFESLEGAQDYMSGFKIDDHTVDLKNMEYSDGALRFSGREMPFAKQAWGQFLRSVVPGGAKFVNGNDCPEDLKDNIINRMLNVHANESRLVRVEAPTGGRPYVKAVLSSGYKPYNNQEFLGFIKEQMSNEKLRVLRPAISSGIFSVNYINPALKINLPKQKKEKRDIMLGVSYRNSEVGKSSVSMLPFTFDWYCENGCIFGQQFMSEISKRILHKGENIDSRVKANFLMEDCKEPIEKLKHAYINMMNTAVTGLYYAHIAHMAMYPNQYMSQKKFKAEIPFVDGENRFNMYNRVNEYAHVADHSENKRLDFERLAGLMVEDNGLV